MSLRTTFYGATSHTFERIQRAFVVVGYKPPQPEGNSDGAFGANIATQYYPELSETQVAAIIRFAETHTLAELHAMQPGDYAITTDDVEIAYD